MKDIQLLTTGEIAKRLGVPPHRVEYILMTRPSIRQLARAGRTRLFDLEAVARIRHELGAIAARKGGVDGPR